MMVFIRELFFSTCWYIKITILIKLASIVNEKKYPKYLNKIFNSIDKEITRNNVREEYHDTFKRTKKAMIEKLSAYYDY